MNSVVTQPMITAIETLEMSKSHLNQPMKERLLALCSDGPQPEPATEKFNVTDLDEMKSLVKSIQRQVVLDNGQILSTASIRDLASLTGTITSLVRLFKAEQATIDQAKEVNELFAAVMAAISKLTPDQQKPFFDELENEKWGMA